jgi:ParB family transcriptional regulator, chromosome partitioning protein
MARKGLLAASLEASLEARDGASATGSATGGASVALRSGSPTVQRFRETFENLERLAIQQIETRLIAPSAFEDRFGLEEGIDDLEASIRGSGQQLPVLLRKRAETGPGGEIYEPVYGRRRILACARIGIPVKALVSDLDDEAAIVAQGLENAARLETSFIERAMFVSRILEAGFKQEIVEKSLGIDQSLVSRMRGVVSGIPRDLILAIGPAHGAGRRQWEELRTALKETDVAPLPRLLAAVPGDIPSPERLRAAIAAARRPAEQPSSRPASAAELVPGRVSARRSGRNLTVKLDRRAPEAFLDHLESKLPALYEEWSRGKKSP